MKRYTLLLAVLLLVLPGCALVKVSLVPQTKPLQEETLEGEGAAKLLLVDIDGTISFKEKGDGFGLQRRPSKVAALRETLRKAEGDADLVGIILRINSPGGSVAASDTMYHEIMSFKGRKKIPVYAHIVEVGASGGYYVAAAADRIYASPTAITGSIGVLAMRFNMEGLFAKIGVSDETYKSGPKKDFWSPFRPSTPEEQKMLQDIIDRLYARFIEVVSLNRQKLMTEQQVRTLADGRIVTAGEAQAAGLIDGVAYLDDTVATMKRELKLEKARVVTYARPGAYASNIYSEMPLPGPQAVSLISINAEEFAPFSGVRFMYLWNP